MHEAATTDPKKTPDHMTIDSNSAEWWSSWSDWLKVAGFILGGIVTIVAVIGWAFSLKAGKLKDEASKLEEAALERYKQESKQATSEADAKAAEANKIAATANAEAAKANERAAILEKDAAESRLELVKLQQKLAWRTITPEQSAKFSALVADAPKGRITIAYLTANEEVATFAAQIAKLLRDGGYDAPESLDKMSAMMPFGGAMVGVVLCVRDKESPMAGILQRALTEIGIDAPGQLREKQTEEIEITVGTKPQ